MKRQYFLLLFILVLASLLRFLNLGSNPPSLTWDEVAWGYNAYSLGIDGKDEFGRFLPYDYLESFGDFKPPVYAYLDILPIKIFGLNEFAVRFPSAFFGVLTILITYFLVLKIFQESKNAQMYAVVSSGLLAISPWHIMLSRAAFEANVASFFLIMGIWLFLSALDKKPWLLILSIVFFVLSMYTFNTARIVAPLFVLLLSFGYWKSLFRMKKEMGFACLVGVMLLLPIIRFLLSPQASLRFREVNIFSNIETIKRVNRQIDNDSNVWWSKILHNRRLAYTADYLEHYFDNLSPLFLFIRGDGNPKFSTQEVGQLYIWEAPFLIAGILLIFRKRIGKWWLFPLWLLLGIIPAATARETPHALRIETTLPTFQVFTAIGIVSFLQGIKKWKYAILTCLCGVILLNFLYFIHDYVRHYSFDYSREWQYGYKESITYVASVEDHYDTVYVTNALGRPYEYYLFYTKTSPSLYRKVAEIRRDVFGFVHVEGFGKYHFVDALPRNSGKRILYVNKPNEVPANAKILKKFSLLDGSDMLVAYTL